MESPPTGVIRSVETTGELLRDLNLDPTCDYQPTGAPKGGFDRAADAWATDVDRHRYLAQ